MRTVACFGHSMISTDIASRVREEILRLLEEDPETEFLVGNHGQFDGIVYHALKTLEKANPDLRYKIVLAYMPSPKGDCDQFPPERTVYPEGLELVHPKYAITKRNRWMVEQCDIVLCYISHPWGGAAHFVERAERSNKKIINLR